MAGHHASGRFLAALVSKERQAKLQALCGNPNLPQVGVDIAAPLAARSAHRASMPMPDAVAPFAPQLSAPEWAAVLCALPDARRAEAVFLRSWALREAYVKALGLGLGFGSLARLEFCPTAAAAGRPMCVPCTLDSAPLIDWRFTCHVSCHLGCSMGRLAVHCVLLQAACSRGVLLHFLRLSCKAGRHACHVTARCMRWTDMCVHDIGRRHGSQLQSRHTKPHM